MFFCENLVKILFLALGKTPFCKGVLARPKDFSKALYTFDIGQNDLAIGFQNMTEEQLKATIPLILKNFTIALKVSSKVMVTVIREFNINQSLINFVCFLSCCTKKEQDSSQFITPDRQAVYRIF